jgi:S-methylmethionine-dependent homocysteine/selenocysteine methylase
LLQRSAEAVLAVRADLDGVYVSAPIGPSTDGYRPGDIDVNQALNYHRWHAERIAATDVDVLVAATFSTAADLEAAAHALAATGRSYILGPVVTASGQLPDGTALHVLIDRIESTVARPPSHWALCCTHPTDAVSAMEVVGAADPHAHDRVRQLKGNGSAATDFERDTADHVLCDEPEPWAVATMRLREDHEFAILGGCCGTDHRHLLSLAVRLASVSEVGLPSRPGHRD